MIDIDLHKLRTGNSSNATLVAIKYVIPSEQYAPISER
jgi:hypothetical protein